MLFAFVSFRRTLLGMAVAFAVGLCALSPALAQDSSCTLKTCRYLDVTLTPEQRAADLVQRMTLEEKISQTVDRASAIPRLGIPEYNWWNEGLHGVARSGYATVFPQAIGMAATWDTSLIQRIGDVISTEARARYNESVRLKRFDRYTGLTYWSPNINIFRDPRWGRGQETYGEDPFLTAQTGVAFIRGLQGNDSTYYKVVATPKHFAVHSGPEKLRHSFNVNPSPFDLEDTYLPAFRASIVDAKADSIMCAYNAVEKSPACASSLLLHDYLRGSWQFKGFVVSDCDAVGDIYTDHKFSPDAAHASAASVRAGTDLDCGMTYKALASSIQDGLLTRQELDESLVRLFTARIRLGMFDPQEKVPFSTLSAKDIDTSEHRQLALEAARKAIVLLKNKDAFLPLRSGQRVAVVGPTADLLQAIEGNYNGAPPAPVLPLRGMQKQFGAENVTYRPGSILAAGVRVPVPSLYLHSEKHGKVHGLKGEYFPTPDFSGAPVLSRIDNEINFSWDNVIPSPKLPERHYSIRWTGYLNFPGAGTYTLGLRGIPRQKKAVDVTGEGQQAAAAIEHAVRIYLDDKLIFDSADGKTEVEQLIDSPGPRALRVEYVRVNNDRHVSLEWIPPAEALLKEAVEAASKSDVVVAFVGLSPDLEGEQMSVHVPGFDGGDRTDIVLPAVQEELLKAVKATGKPLVVVLTSGSAVAANWADANANAVLEAWYGGEEAGTAIAETLAGKNNPSGRLPITFYRGVEDLPPFVDYSMKNRTYRYYLGKPLYPFGYGLSYTTFQYEKATAAKQTLKAGDSLQLTAQVRNTGKIAGEEVVQVYLNAPADQGKANPRLVGFQRVALAPGESKSVSITVEERQLSRVDEKGQRAVAAGKYTAYIGGGQPGSTKDASVPFTITGTKVLPR